MLKRSLIFGSVALFLTAFITLMGCPTSSDDDSDEVGAYKHRIYGSNVDPYVVQEIIDRALAANEPVILEDGLTINAGRVDFKTADVTIGGTVKRGTGAGLNVNEMRLVINAADAKVTWSGSIEGKEDTILYIYSGNTKPLGVETDALAEFVSRLQDIQPTATDAAVRNFTLGAQANYDYSGPSPVNAKATESSQLKRLYVTGTLTIPQGAVAPVDVAVDLTNGLTIVALGTVDVVAGSTDVFAFRSFVLGNTSTLTSSTGNATLIFQPNVSIPRVRVESGKDIKIQTVANGAGSFTIPTDLDGEGTLLVQSPITDSIQIGQKYLTLRNGNITFAAATGTAVDPLNNVLIGSTGKVTFAQTLYAESSFINSEVTFLNGANFSGVVDNPNQYLTFNGDVNLVNDAPLAVPAVTGSITLPTSGKALSLAAEKKISVGLGTYTDGKSGKVPLTPVLAAGSGTVTLARKAGNISPVLTAGGAPKSPTDTKTNAKLISFGGADLAIGSGALTVLEGGTLEVASPAAAGTRTLYAQTGSLVVAAGGTISLPMAAIAGAPAGVGYASIQIDKVAVAPVQTNIEIRGETAAATLKASDGPVTLGSATISGTGSTLALAGTTITVGTAPVGNGNGTSASIGGRILTLNNVNLDISGKGSILVISSNVSANNLNSLYLTAQGKLTLISGGTPVEGVTTIGGLTIGGTYVALSTTPGTKSEIAASLAQSGVSPVSVAGSSKIDTTNGFVNSVSLGGKTAFGK